MPVINHLIPEQGQFGMISQEITMTLILMDQHLTFLDFLILMGQMITQEQFQLLI